jgi:hypothetical protein
VLELSHHILDALENAVEAGASRITIRIEENREKDSLSIQIDDNGRGMDPATVEKALDPFFTTRKVRQVGLGLPLFREAARRCEGELYLDSRPGRGTRLEARFRHSHIDRAPLGRVSSALLAILLSESPVDLDYRHRVGRRVFSFQSGEIRRELDGVPLTHPRVREWMAQFLKEGEHELYGPSEPTANMKKRK